MGKAMEDMTSCTYLKYKQKNYSPSHQSLFLFVTSVARTNFEVELVQRGGSLCMLSPTTIPLTPKRDCIGKFIHFITNNLIRLFRIVTVTIIVFYFQLLFFMFWPCMQGY